MTPEQRKLLEDKVHIWRKDAKWGNMDLRDYNRRCADALEAALYRPTLPSKEEIINIIEREFGQPTGPKPPEQNFIERSADAILAMIEGEG